MPWCVPLLQDLRYAARLLARNPGFTSVAVATLALGIGANTAIFTVVHAVLIEPLPYREPERVVVLNEETRRRPGQANVIGPFNLSRWRDRQQTLEQLAAYYEGRVNLVGGGVPEEIVSQTVTTEFFDTLGVAPMLGRGFAGHEGADGRNDLAIVSYALWQRRFGGDPSIIGRILQVSGREVEVVGVMPPDFFFFVRDVSLVDKPADLWTPFELAGSFREWQGRYMSAVGRLRPGVSLEEARAEMRTIGAALEREFPQFDTGWSIMVRPVREALAGSMRPALVMLAAAVGFVLLIASANVANLLLARGAARQREIALRRALGASRPRVAAQLLTESLALALVGGAAGLLVAQWGVDLLIAVGPASLTELGSVRLNYAVLAFTAAVSLLAAVLAGLAFAIEGSRAAVHAALADGAGQVGAGARRRRLRGALVVAEVALAVGLLFGAGLMLRSLARVRSVDPGFVPARVLTARVSLPSRKYQRSEQRLAFFQETVARLKTLPGVEAAGVVSCAPLTGLCAATSFTIVGDPAPAPGQSPVTEFRVADAGYFDALRIPLRRGRLFSEGEERENRHVAVINEALAREYFGGRDPLGQRLDISMTAPPRVPAAVIGVVADVRLAEIHTPARPTVYWPHSQLDYAAMTLTVRSSSDPRTLGPALERTIHALDGDQPVAEVRTMDDLVARALAARRFNTLLLATFAALAVLLAAVGIYGMLSYAVVQRIPEIGLRLALGAHDRDVLMLIVGHAARLTCAGLALGLGLGFALGGAMSRFLYETRGTDPLTAGAAVAFLGTVAIVASYLPARRAARIEPTRALRYE